MRERERERERGRERERERGREREREGGQRGRGRERERERERLVGFHGVFMELSISYHGDSSHYSCLSWVSPVDLLG